MRKKNTSYFILCWSWNTY